MMLSFTFYGEILIIIPFIAITCLYTAIFTAVKSDKIQLKKINIFLIFAKTIQIVGTR